MSDAILFDRDQVERLEDLADRPSKLGRGKLRARMVKSGEGSISFSLRRPPDRPVNPFG